ncbi:unnamed protein product, partial [Schistosoma turkestanicum]
RNKYPNSSTSSSSTKTKSTVVQNEFIGDNTTNITCSIDHSLFKQSQSISSKQKSYISLLSIVLSLITDCLDLASVFAVFIKTDQNLLKTKTADSVVNTTDVAELNTCFPQLLNCIILTSEACFNQAHESINFTMTTNYQFKSSNPNNGIENLIKNRTVVTLKPLISFLRLWRQMISQKHWPGGHCCDQWWDFGDQQLNSTVSTDVRQEYIEKLFGTSIRCGLLALCTWVRQIIDRFNDYILLSNSCIDNNNVEFQHLMEMQRIDLLNEFSGIIAVLTERDDVIWPNNCYCKPQVYSTLVHLTAYPLRTLLTIPTSLLSTPITHLHLHHHHHESTITCHILLIKQKYCLTAFGQLTRALIGLLCRHGDQCFQLYTDCLPDYFCLIANLSRWLQYSNRIQVIKHDNDQSTYSCSRNSTTTNSDNSSNNNHNKNSNNISNNNFTLTPELIEELYDFESGLETPSNSNTF